MFVPDRLFQPSIMFASRAGACPIKAAFGYSALGYSSGLTIGPNSFSGLTNGKARVLVPDRLLHPCKMLASRARACLSEAPLGALL